MTSELDFEQVWTNLRLVEGLEDLYSDLFLTISKIDTLVKSYGKIISGQKDKVVSLKISPVEYEAVDIFKELRAMTEDVNKTFDIIEAKSTLENFSTKLEIFKNDNEMEEHLKEKWRCLKHMNEEIIKNSERSLLTCSEQAETILSEYKTKLSKYNTNEENIVKTCQNKIEKFLIEEFQKQRVAAAQKLLDKIRDQADEQASHVLEKIEAENRKRTKALEYEEDLRNQAHELKMKILNHPLEARKRHADLEKHLQKLEEQAKLLELSVKYGKVVTVNEDEEEGKGPVTIWEEFIDETEIQKDGYFYLKI
uniref:Uncharacterized protein n=1 Tax=Acrobeloides nanus TaxID=290746 RepID=A0A914DPY8_9BILA